MSSVMFTGLATGLDTASIVAQLVEIRRSPIYRLESRVQDFRNQLAQLDVLKSKLTALQDAAAALDSLEEFNALKTTSSHEGILTATAGLEAAAGSYEIIVESLATARREVSQGYDSPTAVIGQGSVTITVGGTATTLTLAAGSTLADLKDLINHSVDGVSASLINDGSGTAAHHLVLRGDQAGTAGDFSVDFSGLVGGAAPVLTTTQEAADAQLTVDGITVRAGSNHPADVISGLTLDLHQAEPGTVVRLDVASDGSDIEASIKALVDAYNDLFAFIQEQSRPGGDLHGHPTLRSVGSRMENLLTSPLSGGLGGLSMMWEVGIRTGEDRQLEWDPDRFREALEADFAGVRDLFVERPGNLGKGYLIRTAIDDMTDGVDGLFRISSDALNIKIRTADRTIERYERGVESYRLRLETRFRAMESMVAQLQAQGSYLGGLQF